VAEDSRLELGAEVELTPQAGRLIVTPIPPPVFTLKGLLAGVTNANRHREIHTRSAVGREVW
jgi:antitoxin component of MazEF toxin-antitoxin module